LTAYHQNALQPGSTLAEYTIESVLGYGGFSITYLASDAALGQHVAIKEYLPQEIATRDQNTALVIPLASKDAIRHYHWGLKNFVKEARALARFKHTNIVRVLRFIEANGTAYTVMEYEQGQTLAQYLKASGHRLDESNLLRIVMPILNGLHAVHEVGLLHLDIKPENIYLRQDGSPILIDFGSARHALTESRPSGRVTLTHGYAPVEQYPDKGKLGPWSDVYALGATMYRCVTGKRPDDSMDRYRSVLDYKTDPLKPTTRAATGRYRRVILECIERAMQIYAKDRPQTAREFQDELLGRIRPGRSGVASNSAASAVSGSGKSRREVRASTVRVRRYAVSVFAVVVIGMAVWLDGAEISSFWSDLVGSISAPTNVVTPSERARPAANPPRNATVAPKVTKDRQRQDAPGIKSTARESLTRASLPSSLRSVLTGHADWVQAIVFAPAGRRLATSSNDRTVRLWDIDTGAVVNVLKLPYPVDAIDYSPDGRTLVTAGTDGTVQLWDTRAATSVARFEGTGYPLFSVAYAPDGRNVAAAGKDRVVYLWNTGNGNRRALEGHRGEINALAFRPGGKMLVSAGADRSIHVWDVESGQETSTLSGHKDLVLALAFSRDGNWLASGDAGHTIRLWDMRTLTLAQTLNVSQSVLSLAFARDGSWLAAGSADNTVRLFDRETGRLIQTLEGHAGYVQAVAVSPDGSLLASGGRDRKVRLWHAAVEHASRE
jgi:WD40 repeat protein